MLCVGGMCSGDLITLQIRKRLCILKRRRNEVFGSRTTVMIIYNVFDIRNISTFFFVFLSLLLLNIWPLNYLYSYLYFVFTLQINMNK